MEIKSRVNDNRINCLNLYVETTFGEFLSFANKIMGNNEFQRSRVRTSKSVYSLLRNDLKIGCIIPPIVLAIPRISKTEGESISDTDLYNLIIKYPSDVLILDGLQRTFTLIDAEGEISETSTKLKFDSFPLRLEIYVGINRFGILYRMLTLNTGQTPMSARHQLEMLYSNIGQTDIEGMRIVKDGTGVARPEQNEFVFKNLIEGFSSYLKRDELPIDRQDILDNIQMLETISEEDMNKDLFDEFLACYLSVYNALRSAAGRLITDNDLRDENIEAPFGKSVEKVFSSSQALTGFGAAIGKMKDFKLIDGFEDIKTRITRLSCQESESDWFLNMIINFDLIKNNSKKIGNAQRMYFHYFFRELLNEDGDSYLNLLMSVINGYKKYLSQVS